jgi:hypothetical protein
LNEIICHDVSRDCFEEVEKHALDIFNISVKILDLMSFPALANISELWISLASYLAMQSHAPWIRFVYVCLTFTDTCLSICAVKNIAGSCYYLRLLEKLLRSPLFHMAACVFDEFLCHQVRKSNPATDECLLGCLNQLLARNGNGYDANAMFGCPSWTNIIGITRFCVACVHDPNLAMAAVSCVEKILGNKYCGSLAMQLIKNVPEFTRIPTAKQGDGTSVLELQLAINRIVPNRVYKLAIGLDVWKDQALRNARAEQILEFARVFVSRQFS